MIRPVSIEAPCKRCREPIEINYADTPEGLEVAPGSESSCGHCGHTVGDELPTPDMCVPCWNDAGVYTTVRPGRLWCDVCIREVE